MYHNPYKSSVELKRIVAKLTGGNREGQEFLQVALIEQEKH